MYKLYLNKSQKSALIILSIFFTTALILTRYYFFQVDHPNIEPRIILHNQIINGNAQPPYSSRVLVPYCTEIMIKILAVFISHEKAFLVSYLVYDFTAILLLLCTLFYYLRHWFSSEYSLLGALFVSGTITIALRDHYFQPWSILESAFFSTALILLYRKRFTLLGLLIVFASLNRETSFFIILTCFFTSINLKDFKHNKFAIISRKELYIISVYFFLWLFIYLGLKHFLAAGPYIHSIKEYWQWNLIPRNLARSIINNSLFLGSFWVFAVIGIRYADLFIKKTLLVVPFYTLAVFLGSRWWEVRPLISLYPILISSGLFYLRNCLQNALEIQHKINIDKE
ncbi:MAG: hypothetical protein ABIA63_07565 [bacterium]